MLRALITACALTVIALPVHVQAGQLVKPNPEMTYGDLCNDKDPDYVGPRYGENVPYCVRKVNWEQKARIYAAYGIPDKCRKYYTIDHFIPLALGGSNHDANLWPEHRYVKATRRFLEQNLFDELRRGEITQKHAIEAITEAKMNPTEPKPWKCGTSNYVDISAAEDEDQYN